MTLILGINPFVAGNFTNNNNIANGYNRSPEPLTHQNNYSGNTQRLDPSKIVLIGDRTHDSLRNFSRRGDLFNRHATGAVKVNKAYFKTTSTGI